MTDPVGKSSPAASSTAVSAHAGSQYLVVFVTCPPDKAAEIAQTLVGESLVACVNILPNIRSVYRWQGDVTSDEESLLVMKTMGQIYDRLEARIKEIHPYEVPEIISLNIERGSASYLNWLCESVKSG